MICGPEMARLRRLPITIEPRTDEPLNAYLERVAAAHHTTRYSILARLGFDQRNSRHSRRHDGIAMSATTRAAIASTLGLTPERVRAMTLQHFDGTFGYITAPVTQLVDPWKPVADQQCRWRQLSTCGWYHYEAEAHGCRACLAERPGQWQLSWRNRWNLICPVHRIVIDRVAEPPSQQMSDDAITEVLLSQQRLLALAAIQGQPDCTGWAPVITDTAAAIELMLLSERPLSQGMKQSPSPDELLRLLPKAVEWVLAQDDVHLQAAQLTRTSRQRAAATNVLRRRRVAQDSPLRLSILGGLTQRRRTKDYRPRFHIPDIKFGPAAQLPRRLSRIPQVLPEKTYIGDLSDVFYPAPPASGPMLAALACVALLRRCTLSDTPATLALPERQRVPMHRLWRRLRADGREDRAWQAIEDAVRAMLAQDIDYGRRRAAISRLDPKQLAAAVDCPASTTEIDAWLSFRWARNYNNRRLNSGISAASEMVLDSLDSRFGTAMAAHLDRHLDRGAA